MSKAESPAVVCASCGHQNPAREKFCLACAARLGREPSITRPGQRAALPPADSRFDAPRTVLSQPARLQAPAVDASGFWFKFCMAGLVVMLGFMGWALYVLTGSKAVAPLAAAPVAPAPVEPVASTPAPVPLPLPLPLPSPSSATVPARAVAATAPVAIAPTPKAAASPAPAPAPAPVPAARVRSSESRRAASAASRQALEDEPFERPRQPDMSWQQRAMPYEQPYYAPRPMPSQQAVMPTPDAGPPIVVGPGPLYDYSTPGAVRR